MSKKPLVPNKNPKGRGKGMGSAGKVAKAPRMTRICSRLSKDRLTILIAEVDSIAKGFKGLKGLNGLKGGGIKTFFGFNKTDNKPEAIVKVDYYERIKGLFSEENTKNIKRLKEDLVINILGTMADRLENLVDFKDEKGDVVELKRMQLLKFISIINEIDNLGQEHISKIIMNDSLKELDYIDKITTLVMINILKKVYKSKFTNLPLKETTFKYLYNTKDLIMKITQEYNGKNDAKALKDLTEDVKRQLEYYNHIYILDDYAATKGDENDAIKIIEWMKLKCIGIEKDKFIKFIYHPFLDKDDFTTDCITNLVLKGAIDNYNETIKMIKEIYDPLGFPNTENYINFIKDDNPITKIYIEGLLSTRGLLSPDILYKLYKYIIYYEDKMKLFPSMKTKYIECVKVFYDDTITRNYYKEPLTLEKKQEYLNASIKEDEIKELESSITLYNKTYEEINEELKKWGNIEKDINNYIPVDLTNIVFLYNKLCNSNYIYESIYKKITRDADKILILENKREIEKKVDEEKQSNIKDELQKINKSLENITRELSLPIISPERINNLNQNKIMVTATQKQLQEDLKNLELKIAEKDLIYKNEISEANNEAFDNYNRSRSPSGELGGGKLTTKYISTGNFVYILYEKKRIRRCVYAKAKGRGKYCKIKGDYILVSKLKVV